MISTIRAAVRTIDAFACRAAHDAALALDYDTMASRAADAWRYLTEEANEVSARRAATLAYSAPSGLTAGTSVELTDVQACDDVAPAVPHDDGADGACTYDPADDVPATPQTRTQTQAATQPDAIAADVVIAAAANGPADKPAPRKRSKWVVVVGNVGSVYSGHSERKARETFEAYKTAGGRAEGEEVTLCRDGEAVERHEPRRKRRRKQSV